jgi:RecA-family ATPase
MSAQDSEILLAVRAVEAKVDATAEQLNRRLDRINALLHGPHSDKPGIVLRVDRIEQLVRHARWIGGLVAAAIGSLASWAMTLLSAKH